MRINDGIFFNYDSLQAEGPLRNEVTRKLGKRLKANKMFRKNLKIKGDC